MPFPLPIYPNPKTPIYLNAAAVGLQSITSLEAQARANRAFGMRGEGAIYEFLEVQNQARENLAQILGVQSDDLGFTASTSHAMDIFAQMGAKTRRHTILTPTEEFPSTVLPYTGRNYRHRIVEGVDGSYPVEAFRAAMDEDVYAIVVSRAQFSTGTLTDLRPLADLAHEYGALLIANITQAVGLLPVDLKACGVDLAAGTGHKWLLSGLGNAFAYIAPHIRDTMELPGQGWLSVETPMDMCFRNFKKKENASALEYGAMGLLPRVALLESTRHILEVGQAEIFAYTRQLSQRLRDGAQARGLKIQGSQDPACQGATVNLAHGDPVAQAEKLMAHGVAVSSRGGIRLSPHIYNTAEEIDEFWRIWDALP